MSSDRPTLAYSLVTAPEHTPSRWVLFLHGILGSGNTFRTLARRWVVARPELGVVLVDLRMHGRSQGFAPPHTIDAAARDLLVFDQVLAGSTIAGVVGHSFGGKVALDYVALKEGALDRAWIIDSTPGIRPTAAGSESTVRVYELLRTLPRIFPTRAAFNQALTAAGLDIGMVQWLAMNVESAEGGYRFRLDLDAIGDLLGDYFERDLWPVVEHPPGRVSIDLIVGGRSQVVSAEDREQARRAAAETGRVSLFVIEDAAHWVHVDAPDALFERLLAPPEGGG